MVTGLFLLIRRNFKPKQAGGYVNAGGEYL